MICFCEDDLRLMMMMAEDERQAGNVTGSELFMTIGERMQTILTSEAGAEYTPEALRMIADMPLDGSAYSFKELEGPR